MTNDERVKEIMAYEQGELNGTQMVELFAELIKDGTAWTLQGVYGRTAEQLIERGVLTRHGDIDYDLLDDILQGGG